MTVVAQCEEKTVEYCFIEGQKSSLVSTGLDSKLSAGVGGMSTDRKRKPPTIKSSVKDKKPLVEKAQLKSSLLKSSSLLTQSNLRSSLLGTSSLSSSLVESTLQRKSLSARDSHATSQTKPLTGSLLGNTASFSLLSRYTSALTSNLSTGKSLQGQGDYSATQKMSGLSHASVLTNQQPVGGTSLKTNLLLTSSKQTTGFGSLTGTHGQEKSVKSDNKKKSKKRAAEDKSDFEKYKVKAPRYDLGKVLPKDKGVEVPKFVNPSKDPSLNRPAIPLHDVNGLKVHVLKVLLYIITCII